MKRRRRFSPIMIAGLLALLSALGLVALLSISNGALTQIDATAQRQTVAAIVQTRIAQTATAEGTEQVTLTSP